MDLEKDNVKYQEICQKVPEYKQFTYDEYVKTTFLMTSREFGAKMKNGKSSSIYVPYAEMCNHESDDKTNAGYEYDEELKGFYMMAMKNIERGE